MKKTPMLISLAACFLALGCDSETREGNLSLSGTAPVRIVDEGDKTVEFGNGAVKVEFKARSGNKFQVTLEQGKNKAQFSGKVPNNDSYNFTLRGRDIGQLVDLTSTRKIDLNGPRETRVGTGDQCGMNGTYVTEETWQKGDEAWTVSFADTNNGQSMGLFGSYRKGMSFLVDVRDLYCRERPERDRGGRGDRSVKATPETPASLKKFAALVESGVKFD